VRVNEAKLNAPGKILAFAAVVEVGTGLVLIIYPAIVVRVLLGAEVSDVGTLLGRCFGIALLALGLACWPSRGRAERGSAPILRYRCCMEQMLVRVTSWIRGRRVVPGS